MHNKINVVGQTITDLLRYHERKVQRQVAECLYAGNMLKPHDLLTTAEKQYHLRRLQLLNDRVVDKTVHIYLSWSRDEVLDNDTMRNIAKEYMRGIGLHEQPYLVYRHRDMPHQHLHIVTTNIRHDGAKINIWEGERWKGHQVARQLEIKYGLHQAGVFLPDEEWRKKHPVQKVVYGQTPLKPTINAVLESILPRYLYTNLEELNALLRPYQIRAHRGLANSVTHQQNGLLYYPLNAQGKEEGSYVKSSALHSKPTLTKLQARFRENVVRREEYRQRLTTAIDWIFHQRPVSMDALKQALQKEKINMVEQDNHQGQRQLYYIDQLTKTVWAGSSLGRTYSGEGIRQRVISAETYEQIHLQKRQLKQGQQQRLQQKQEII